MADITSAVSQTLWAAEWQDVRRLVRLTKGEIWNLLENELACSYTTVTEKRILIKSDIYTLKKKIKNRSEHNSWLSAGSHFKSKQTLNDC